MYRLLHLADLHLDRAFAAEGCHGDLARRRRQGLRDALVRAGEEAQARDCRAVTLGGDLFEHERASLDSARFLAEIFASWRPLRVLIAPGNHDALMPGSPYRRAEWPDNVHVFSEPRLSPLPLDDGLTIWGLAHLEPAWTGDPLDCEPCGGDDGVHLALFHGAELGSRPEGKSIHGPFRAEKIRDRGFAAALCGHYHRRRLDIAAGLLYPGSPEPLTFDESGDRGPVVVEVDTAGKVAFTPLALNRWSAITVECDVAECGSVAGVVDLAAQALTTATASRDPRCTLVRLDLSGEVDPALSLDLATIEGTLRDRHALAMVRLRDLTSAALDIDQIGAERSSRGAFTRASVAAIASAASDEESAVLEDALRYGLMALAGNQVGLR